LRFSARSSKEKIAFQTEKFSFPFFFANFFLVNASILLVISFCQFQKKINEVISLQREKSTVKIQTEIVPNKKQHQQQQ